MRRRFRLLKDSPELKAGAILEETSDNGDQDFNVIQGTFQCDNKKRVVTYWREFVLNQPDWFEEVGILWLTTQQIEEVIAFLGLKEKPNEGTESTQSQA